MSRVKRMLFTALTAIAAVCVFFGGGYAGVGLFSESVSAAEITNDRLSLNYKSISLGIGETAYLSANVPSGDKIKKWTTSDSSVVTVDQGKIKGLSVGTARVAVRTVNGVVAVCNVTVKKAPKSVLLNAKELNIGVGESYSFLFRLPEGTASNYAVFTSDKRSVVSCDTRGNIKGLKEGTANVKIVLFNGVSYSCRVNVKKTPESAAFDVSELELGVGENRKLSVRLPSGSASKFREYTVENPHFVTCDGKGNLTGRKPGTTEVKLRLFNGVTAACKVTVKRVPDSVKLRTDSLTLGAGEKYTLTASLPKGTASSLTYSTSNENVLSVGKKGLITAKNSGTAYVTVKLFNGVSAKCRVTVKKAPETVSLNKTEIVLKRGDKFKLYGSLPDGTASRSKKFSVDGKGVVSCDSSGNIKALSTGTATVTLILFNGVKASCEVTVQDDVEYITVEKDLAVLDVGETFRISARTPEGVELAGAKFSSSDTSVARVSSKGVIKAVAPGTANIIVKSCGKVAKVGVVVYGNKTYSTFPTVDETDSILNTAKLSPKTTNCPQLDDLVGRILSQITNSNMTTAQKVRACYDYLSQNCTYGYGYIPTQLPGNYNYSSDYFIVTMAYPILKNHVGTCENYASAFTVMMRRIGLEADVVYGLVGMRAGGKGGHYWTNITINNKHYVFDTQVEGNNLGYDKYVYHYWYGMRPELNYRAYEYKEFLRARDFSYS